MATKDAKLQKRSKDLDKKKTANKTEKHEEASPADDNEDDLNNSAGNETIPCEDGVPEALSENLENETSPQNVYYEPPLSDMIVQEHCGEKVHGLYDGFGTILFDGNNSYEGDLSEGLMHGKGKYTWENGLVYEGDLERNSITGKGVYTWPDGSTYNGDVLNGKRHGYGIFMCKDEQKTYNGMWRNGKRHGKGRLDFTNSGDSFYDGEWDKNSRQGYGSRQYSSGNIYVGMWKNNVRHGEGMMKWFECDQIYDGMWENGVQHGWGQHVWYLQRMVNSQYALRNMYIGEFSGGQRHGYGTFLYSSGARYDGEWENSVKHGKGKFTFKNGRVYEGTFSQDRSVEYPSVTLDGSTSPHPDVIRTRTPLPYETLESFSTTSTNTLGPSFQLEIHSLTNELSTHNSDEECRQVMFVILQHMSTLRNIYAFYSSLGCEGADSPDNTYIMRRMQFWRLLKDCKLHHTGYCLSQMDRWLMEQGMEPSDLHNPNEKILQRQFINMLILLAYHVYKDDCEDELILAACVTKLLTTSILKRACSVKGNFYDESRRALNALVHYDQTYDIYTELCFPRKHSPYEPVFKMRDFLWMLKDCGLINSDLSASTVIKILSGDDPNAADGSGCCNLDLEMTYLEFFEALLGCAVVYVTDAMIQVPSTPDVSEDARSSLVGSAEPISQVGDESAEHVRQVTSVADEEQVKRTKTSTSNNTMSLSDAALSIHASEKHLQSGNSYSGPGENAEPANSDIQSSIESIVGKEETEILEEEIDELTQAFNHWANQIHFFFTQKFFPLIHQLIEKRNRVPYTVEITPEPYVKLSDPNQTNPSEVLSNDVYIANVSSDPLAVAF